MAGKRGKGGIRVGVEKGEGLEVGKRRTVKGGKWGKGGKRGTALGEGYRWDKG